MSWYKPWTWADESASATEKRDDLNRQGGMAGTFANRNENTYRDLGAEAQQSRNYLRDQAMGRGPSLAAEQLRQGLMQQQGQLQSMAAGGPASAAPMNARTAMIQAGRASSAMSGNAAMARIAEQQAAQKAWADSILGARAQDLQASLGSRQNAINAFGGVTPEGSFLDKWGNAIATGAGLASGGGGKK
jgi:hypothetical protein